MTLEKPGDIDLTDLTGLLNMTYDCFYGGEKHCGSCAGCLKRKRRFLELGIEDKTSYEVYGRCCDG